MSTEIASQVSAEILKSIDLDIVGETKLLVAFSGGADSVALLNILKDQLPAKIKLYACHVNHGLRPDTEDDEYFCRLFCQERGIPLLIRRLYQGGLPRPDAPNEADLREARYAELYKVAREIAAPYVVTAHHFDDQVETILMRLLRGTTINGLSAISARRTLFVGVTLLRPMLEVTKTSIERYLLQKNLNHRVDTTNSETKFRRNFLRLRVMPLLKIGFAGFEKALVRFAALAAEDGDYLDSLAARACTDLSQSLDHTQNQGHLNYSRSAFCALARPLQRRIIAQLLQAHEIEVNALRVELALQAIAGPAASDKLTMGTAKFLHIAESRFGFKIETPDNREARFGSIAIDIPEPGKISRIIVPWLNQVLVIRGLPEGTVPKAFPDRRSLQCLVDLTQVKGLVELRLRRPGDRIQPLGMDLTVRLKRFLQTHKPEAGQRLLASNLRPGGSDTALTPELERRLAVVLACDEEILWVPGLGLSNKIKVQGQASHEIEFMPMGSQVDVQIC